MGAEQWASIYLRCFLKLFSIDPDGCLCQNNLFTSINGFDNLLCGLCLVSYPSVFLARISTGTIKWRQNAKKYSLKEWQVCFMFYVCFARNCKAVAGVWNWAMFRATVKKLEFWSPCSKQFYDFKLLMTPQEFKFSPVGRIRCCNFTLLQPTDHYILNVSYTSRKHYVNVLTFMLGCAKGRPKKLSIRWARRGPWKILGWPLKAEIIDGQTVKSIWLAAFVINIINLLLMNSSCLM